MRVVAARQADTEEMPTGAPQTPSALTCPPMHSMQRVSRGVLEMYRFCEKMHGVLPLPAGCRLLA